MMIQDWLDTAFDWARAMHIIGGFAALLVFWIPMVTSKGGTIHRQVGWLYVWAMVAVAVTAWYMGIWRIGLDRERTEESIAFAYFLIFIALLSWSAAWYGIRVLRFKQRSSAHRNPLDLLTPLALVLAGIGISLHGWSIGIPLLQWFPLVGILLGSQQLYYWLNSPRGRMHWWFEHMGSMMGCCIATITAFTVFGAPRLLQLESGNPILWLLPTMILTPVIIGFSKYYQKKFYR